MNSTIQWKEGHTLPYLIEAADGTVLHAAEATFGRAQSTARLYASDKRVETRVTEWRDTEHGFKSREVWCASDYPATVRFPAQDSAFSAK